MSQDDFKWKGLSKVLYIADPLPLETPKDYIVSLRQNVTVDQLAEALQQWGLAPLGYISRINSRIIQQLSRKEETSILPFIDSKWVLGDPTNQEYLIQIYKESICDNASPSTISIYYTPNGVKRDPLWAITTVGEDEFYQAIVYANRIVRDSNYLKLIKALI
jgi:hypothetical protein